MKFILVFTAALLATIAVHKEARAENQCIVMAAAEIEHFGQVVSDYNTFASAYNIASVEQKELITLDNTSPFNNDFVILFWRSQLNDANCVAYYQQFVGVTPAFEALLQSVRLQLKRAL